MWTQRHWVANYLDDIIGVSSPSEAQNAFLTLTNLLKALGLLINYKKVEEPHYEITCLGININARSAVLTIPNNKIRKIKYIISQWLTKETATKHQLQNLVGNLLHIHRCVKPARLFTNSILQTLCEAPVKGSVRLSESFFKDINWFAHFLEVFNGSVEIHSIFTPTSELYVDSCLTGMGAFDQGKVYAIPVHSSLSLRSILHLEAANVLVALRCWVESLRNSHCLIWCDNWAVVNAFTSHKINDPFLLDCARSMWLICAIYNINMKIKHIAGTSNLYADILSRWDHYKYLQNDHVTFLNSCEWYFPSSTLMLHVPGI